MPCLPTAYFKTSKSPIHRRWKYVQRVKPITESFGGRYVVLGGEVQLKEGDWTPVWPVIIEFPSMQAANEWYNSTEYAPLKALRMAAGEFSAVFISG